jgi:hypothetical protein
MAGHSWSTPLQSLLQGSTTHHLKTPRCPSLLLPYKRAGQGSTRDTGQTQAKSQVLANKSTQLRDQHLKQSPLYSFFLSLRLGRGALSHKLVTPMQAPWCKEIQNSPLPAGRRAFFCPNQDKPRVFSLHHHQVRDTQHSLVGLGPPQDRTLTH